MLLSVSVYIGTAINTLNVYGRPDRTSYIQPTHTQSYHKKKSLFAVSTFTRPAIFISVFVIIIIIVLARSRPVGDLEFFVPGRFLNGSSATSEMK
jgi:hypothetical protein